MVEGGKSFIPTKGGGDEKSFSHPEGRGDNKFWGSFNTGT